MLRQRAKSTLGMLRLGCEQFIRPSGPPALLSSLTEHLLIVASDAVRAVALIEKERGEAVSGKDQYRLLAWVVADARGATETLDKALAETVGKRLDRQAQKVRTELEGVSIRAKGMRKCIRKQALGDEALAATLQADLEVTREAERRELEKPFSEVYVGFHELESLLAPVPAQEVQEADDDRLGETNEPKKRRLEDFEDILRAEGVKFPFCMYEQYEQQSGAIPPDLAKALGPDTTKALWDALGYTMRIEGEYWWSVGLPHFTSRLLQDKVRDDGYHAEGMEASEAREKRRHVRTRGVRGTRRIIPQSVNKRQR